jgi:hypothetical protein
MESQKNLKYGGSCAIPSNAAPEPITRSQNAQCVE